LAGKIIKSCAKAELAKKTAKSAQLTNCILCFVVIMLPPFSLSLNVSGNQLGACLKFCAFYGKIFLPLQFLYLKIIEDFRLKIDDFQKRFLTTQSPIFNIRNYSGSRFKGSRFKAANREP